MTPLILQIEYMKLIKILFLLVVSTSALSNISDNIYIGGGLSSISGSSADTKFSL